MTDMLVRNSALGRALAQTLSNKPALLMRGHGAVVVGPSVPAVVSRSIQLEMNAKLQAQAMAMGRNITYLDPEEVRKIMAREVRRSTGHGSCGSEKRCQNSGMWCSSTL